MLMVLGIFEVYGGIADGNASGSSLDQRPVIFNQLPGDKIFSVARHGIAGAISILFFTFALPNLNGENAF